LSGVKGPKWGGAMKKGFEEARNHCLPVIKAWEVPESLIRKEELEIT